MKVTTANVYAFNRERDAARERLEQSGAVVIGAQEAWQFGPLGGYHRLGSTLGGRPALEVPIFLRKDAATYLGGGAYRVKPDLGASYTPERWITWARFEHAGYRWCAINTHFDAALQDRDTGEVYAGAARVQWAQRHMRQLLAEIRNQRGAGYRPLVTADFNYFPRSHQDELWRWSPHIALERARLHYEWHRLDGIGVPARFEHSSARPFELPGSDHKAVSVSITLPGRNA